VGKKTVGDDGKQLENWNNGMMEWNAIISAFFPLFHFSNIPFLC